jgi:hypothetical protein
VKKLSSRPRRVGLFGELQLLDLDADPHRFIPQDAERAWRPSTFAAFSGAAIRAATRTSV